jgi:hypothetical protein
MFQGFPWDLPNSTPRELPRGLLAAGRNPVFTSLRVSGLEIITINPC